MSAKKFDQGKIDWTLVDFKSLEPLAEAMGYGSKKYGRLNWKKGLDEKRLLAASFRHLIAYKEASILDPESGVNHLGHLMANAMMMIYNRNNLKNDDEANTEK